MWRNNPLLLNKRYLRMINESWRRKQSGFIKTTRKTWIWFQIIWIIQCFYWISQQLETFSCLVWLIWDEILQLQSRTFIIHFCFYRCYQMDDYSPAKNLMTMCFTFYYIGKILLPADGLLKYLSILSRSCPSVSVSLTPKEHLSL